MSGAARRLGKFCLFGLLVGIGLGCALLATSYLTGETPWSDSSFGRLARILCPSVSRIGMLDADATKSLVLTLFVIAIGANGLLYAFLGLAAFFVHGLVDRIAEAILSRQTNSNKV